MVGACLFYVRELAPFFVLPKLTLPAFFDPTQVSANATQEADDNDVPSNPISTEHPRDANTVEVISPWKLYATIASYLGSLLCGSESTRDVPLGTFVSRHGETSLVVASTSLRRHSRRRRKRHDIGRVVLQPVRVGGVVVVQSV